MGRLVNFCAGVETYVLPSKRVGAILLNVPANASSNAAIMSAKRMLELACTTEVILDSGGFQLHEAERLGKTISYDPSEKLVCNATWLNIAPLHVVQGAAIFRPRFFIGLDFPIRKGLNSQEKPAEFMKKLGFNAIWAKECSALRSRLCPDVQFFLPVQCYDLNQLGQFMGLIPGVQFDGFSMPIRNLTDMEIILFLVRFRQMGVRQVHILGTSKITAIAIASYMARHYFDWVSFDATTWRIWAEKFLYMNPLNLEQDRITSNVKINANLQMDCPCPFCRGKTFTFIKNMPGADRTAFLRSHNWWVIEKATRELYAAAGNIIGLERCLRARAVNPRKVEELCRALSLADALKSKDIRTLQSLL